MAAIMTLPWSNFRGHSHWDEVHWIPFVSSGINPRDIVLNVLAFLPYGLLLASDRFRGRSVSLFGVVGVAALFSATGEFYQVFCHNRFPSTTDIVSNTLGAYCGFVIHAIRSRTSPNTH